MSLLMVSGIHFFAYGAFLLQVRYLLKEPRITPLTDKQMFLIMVCTLILGWSVSEVVVHPWFRRFLALLGLLRGE